MTQKPTIRAYRDKDRQALIEIYQLCFPNSPPWNEAAKMIDDKIAIDPQGLLVGMVDGRVVSSIMAGYDGHRGWLNCLATHPEHQRKGYAAAMVASAVDLLAQRGAAKINLQIRGGDTKLEAIYAKLGFTTEARISMGLVNH